MSNKADKSGDKENTLILTTEEGPVVIELLVDKAPKHAARIKELAREGFYDGLIFHRVINDFMAQGGCPDGSGMGGSKKPNLKAEFNDVSHKRGICSMARSQNPDSANSQFFIVFDDASFLDKQYTAWGKVTSGMEHIDALPRGEPPRKPGKIVSMKVAADVDG
ncbi:MAG: peptidylprolyl isomerase [Alphaproteobacteria bacterium]